jgi:matrixin
MPTTLGFALVAGVICCATVTSATADVATFKLLTLGGNRVHWKSSRNEQGPTLYYALENETREFPDARNCRKLTSLDALEPLSHLAGGVIQLEVSRAFAMWQAAANINFREAETPATADILIGAQVEPEGWAFTNVSYDARSRDAIKPISRALICLNPLKSWKVGFDGNLTSYDLRYTIAHEIGHAIGLDHPDEDGQIMGYRYHEQFRQLQPGDFAGAVLLYGSRLPEAVIADADKSGPPVYRSSSPAMMPKHSITRALRSFARPSLRKRR